MKKKEITGYPQNNSQLKGLEEISENKKLKEIEDYKIT